jgi:hypothetical protein
MRRDQWIQLLEHHAGEVAAPAMHGADAPRTDAPRTSVLAPLPPDPTLFSGNRSEQQLWRACAGEVIDPWEAIRPEAGSLLTPDEFLAIEVWAECELSAVHALHRLVRERAAKGMESEPLARRLADAVRWHLEHTQPDNSTNRPWALHVFLLADDGSGEAALYAETLLHNVLATHARQEPLSRWILGDAARELRLIEASDTFRAG